MNIYLWDLGDYERIGVAANSLAEARKIAIHEIVIHTAQRLENSLYVLHTVRPQARIIQTRQPDIVSEPGLVFWYDD